MSKKTYKDYFKIDESYFPAVNEDVIKNKPYVWKSYYPHNSFIQLLRQTIKVLTNNQRMSIWVEGAYGTGKSHAVLTLKKLLECSNEDLKEYFDRYEKVFGSKDLYNEFYNLKNQSKKILTVHRYGSSDVRNDRVLMESVQESIISSLKEQGYTYFGQMGLKGSIINWLSDENNKAYFDNIIKSDEYKISFFGMNADNILNQLKNYGEEKSVQELIEKISSLGEEKGIKPFVLKKEDLKSWILDVIDGNNIKAIFFIWDEFSDYFNLNKGNLSGFQFLVEISETYPFYFVIVTHKSDIFFENSRDDVKTKINGRFISPHCSIDLPDNMAFLLTAHAMQKVDDEATLNEWTEIVDTLYEMTHDSRKEVMNVAKIGEAELKGVLPIHPYAALVLKHIASAFDSNQRSMFDFIKNDRGDEIKGFQWFINNYGPEDEEEALLTVDLLWDFFYEKGKDQLAPQIREILDVYGRTESHQLHNKQKRVLKTILLLQAINEKVGDSVALFIPNNKNLALAFEGTDITKTNAENLAASLVRDQIIFERPMGGGQVKYSALTTNGNIEEILKEKERLTREIRTNNLIDEGEFANDFTIPKSLEIRYKEAKLLSVENIKPEVNKLRLDSENHPTRLYVAYTFARNEEESIKIRNEIKKCFEEGFEKIVFIDYSTAYLSIDLFNQYIDNMANCNYQKGKDANQSRTYDKNAREAIRRWKNQIKNSYPRVFTSRNQEGANCSSETEIKAILTQFDKEYFPFSLETNVNVIDNMYTANALKLGADCGITGDIKGTYRSTTNENTRLERQFSGVWNVDRYWEIKPTEILSRMKIAVERVIKENMDKSSRVSISEIYRVLKEEPFGLMPCNLTSFVLGFILKEYADDLYNWSDDVTTTPMSVDKLKEMIEEILKLQNTPNPKYRDKYIVAMSPEQREFNKSTAFVFGIDETFCSSIENTKSRIRSQMVNFGFPIWTLKYGPTGTSVDKNAIDKLIDLYIDLANNKDSGKSETDIALEIGKIYLDNSNLKNSFKVVLTAENCLNGMKSYLGQYKNGKLVSLARLIGDTGYYVNELKKKFSEATNWVWDKTTVDAKIDETIVEYSIVDESNKIIVRTSSYKDCINEWAKKTCSFKVSFNTIRNEVGDLTDFLAILYQIKKNGYVYEQDKNKFLDCIISQTKEFREFSENQITLLRKVSSIDLSDLSNQDLSEIANKELYDVFAIENSEFQSRLEAGVKKYKANMAKYKLTSLWKEKTNSENPKDWCEKNKMPILCLIPENEQEAAREIFDNFGIGDDKNKIEGSIKFVESFKYFGNLSNQTIKDECFRKYILKQYSSLIDNLDEIKNLICSRLHNINPYHWFGNYNVETLVKEYADKKYRNGGSEKANKIIDQMDPESLKKYLKDLIKENSVVGIEIINSKK